MLRCVSVLVCAFALALCFAPGPASAEDEPGSGSPRIALVVGNGAYAATPLPTAANDAGLVAQTLAAAGFDVTGARDLDGAALRRSLRDFLDKASAGGPRGVAVVYLAGHAMEIEGENYFAPIDAHLDRPAGLAIESLRLADVTRALAATTLGTKVVIVDGAHADAQSSASLGAGLGLVNADRGVLVAFNAAPGTVAPVDAGPYGTYARILTQNMKQGGVPVDEMFNRVRVSVNTDTRGGVVPWHASKLLQVFTFFDRGDNAPALGGAQVPFTALKARPLKDFSPEQAYDVAVARDTLASYEDYLAAFPDQILARRIRAMLAVRREAQVWRDAARVNGAAAYWTYLRLYAKGPHAPEAQRRLARLAADRQPPAGFVPLAFETPPPSLEETALLGRRVPFADPDLPPPPPPPLFLLPPLPAEEVMLQPPPPPPGPRLLPVPVAVAIPFVRAIIAPGLIAPPRAVAGRYPQPRPFMAGPANRGLVPHFVGDRPDGTKPIVASPPGPTVPQPPEPRAPVPPVLPQAPARAAPAAPVAPLAPKEPVRSPAAKAAAHPAGGSSIPGTPHPGKAAHPEAAAHPDAGQLAPRPAPPTPAAGVSPPTTKPVPPKPGHAKPPVGTLPGKAVRQPDAIDALPPTSPEGAVHSAPETPARSPAKSQEPHPVARPSAHPALGAAAPDAPHTKRPTTAPAMPGEAAPKPGAGVSSHGEARPDCGHPGQAACH